MRKYQFFEEGEFAKCVPSCSLSQMDSAFMIRLDTARCLAGIPFVLNSAYRSPEWDKSRGRSGKSFHCVGRAVDISCKDSVSRLQIVRALIKAGFIGIGIADTFIHVDDRTFPNLWLYD